MPADLVPLNHPILQDDSGPLRTENQRLRRELAESESARAAAEQDARLAQSSIRMLRQQLGPLYRALQAIFGEIEAAGVEDVPMGTGAPSASAARSDARVTAVWESWKVRLGGQCAKVIDVLLTHGEMNTTQLAIAVGTRRQNIPNLIYKLNQAGLINKNGGRFSLKSL